MRINLDGGVESRRFIPQANDTEKRIRATSIRSLALAQVEPDYFEVCRAGRRFCGGMMSVLAGALTGALAPVSAIPTTTASQALFNGANANGVTLCIDTINFWLGSGTAAAGATLMATVAQPAVYPTTELALWPRTSALWNVTSTCGSGKGSRAFWVGNNSTYALAASPSPVWLAVVSNFQPAGANIGMGDGWVDFKGGVLVPPGYALGLAILSGAGTSPLYGVSLQWSELELDLE